MLANDLDHKSSIPISHESGNFLISNLAFVSQNLDLFWPSFDLFQLVAT